MKMLMLGVISNRATEMISCMIDRVGKASIFAIFSFDVADEAGVIEQVLSASIVWAAAFDWLSLLAGIGTVTFIVKNIISARKEYLEMQMQKIKNKDEKD